MGSRPEELKNMQGIRFLDVHHTYDMLKEDLDEAFHRVMDSGVYIGGAEVEHFENEFAAFCGLQHCIGVGNGLDALVLSLRAAEVGSGDEVIVPANTFIATWLAVYQIGADIVPVDADQSTMLMDLSLVETAINSRTKAVLPVHLYGAMVPMEELRSITDRYDVLLLEDAAQAHGARTGSVRPGQLGKGAAFSFYPGKNLGAFGDAGAFVTDDASLANKVRRLANYGSTRKYFHETHGVNSRLDPLQAAFLSAKLPHLKSWNDRRRQIAEIYRAELSNCVGLDLPQVPVGSEPVWHLFVVRHERRDELAQRLLKKGIQTSLHYPVANHQSEAFANQFEGQSYRITESICRNCLSLPIGPHIDLREAREIAAIVAETVRQMS